MRFTIVAYILLYVSMLRTVIVLKKTEEIFWCSDKPIFFSQNYY